MKNLIVPAALALVLGSTAAFAQADSEKSTTTVTQPDGSQDKTTTTTTTANDGYTQYRKTVTSKKHYNAAAFVAPSGFTVTRFSTGQRVPSVLLSGGTVLSNYTDYALVAPPNGLTWIRVGNDALLVDSNTGEVIQADYDLFKG
jgi:Ni/Co efflux regulator RcnB